MAARTEEDPPLICPFSIVADVNESAPFHFTGIQSDADKDNRIWIVHVVRKALWSMGKREVQLQGTKGVTMTHGWADYSIDGLESEIQIERKSVLDLYATLGQRRLEFQAEMQVLNECKYAAVVVEGDLSQLLLDPPPNSQVPPKVISRTILSWSLRFPNVHWFCCMHRRHAELVTFQLLMRYWLLREERAKEAASEIARDALSF